MIIDPAGGQRPARTPRGRCLPVRRAALAVLAAGVLAGCYTYVPLESSMPAGTVVSLTLNDRGRAAMGDSLGPSVRTVEGGLHLETDSTYELRVTRVDHLNGLVNIWTGEAFTIPKQFATAARERRLSRTRSLAVGIAGAAGVAMFVTRGFGVFGGHESSSENGGNGVDQ